MCRGKESWGLIAWVVYCSIFHLHTYKVSWLTQTQIHKVKMISPSLWLLVKCRETKALYFFLAADNLTTSTDLQRPMKGHAVLRSFSPFSHYRLLLHICSICLITTPSVLPLRALPGFIPCWRTPTGAHSSLQYVLHIIPLPALLLPDLSRNTRRSSVLSVLFRASIIHPNTHVSIYPTHLFYLTFTWMPRKQLEVHSGPRRDWPSDW